MKRYNPKYLDEEERDLMEAINEADTRNLAKPTPEEQSTFKAAAKRYIQGETKMNIRIDSHELEKIKQRAEKEGLKYQTFIKSILHRYLTGQLVDRSSSSQ